MVSKYINWSNPDIDNIEDLYKIEINKVDGVEEILSFSSEFDKATREFTVTFTVRITDESTLTITI
jgi:hypothetical protein